MECCENGLAGTTASKLFLLKQYIGWSYLIRYLGCWYMLVITAALCHLPMLGPHVAQ